MRTVDALNKAAVHEVSHELRKTITKYIEDKVYVNVYGSLHLPVCSVHLQIRKKQQSDYVLTVQDIAAVQEILCQ